MKLMVPAIIADVWSIIALFFTICMAKRHVTGKKEYKKYVAASMIVIVLLIIEISTTVAASWDISILVILNRITNTVAFSISPLVPYALLQFSYGKKVRALYKRLLETPLYLNALICILSYKTGWVFYINSQNNYARGNLLVLPILVCLFYYVLMVSAAIKNGSEYEIEDKTAFAVIVSMPITATVLQFLFRNLLLVWNSVALALLLYYIFLRELQFTFDIQTGIKNRAAFEKEMEQYANNNKNAAIVMFDLNYLKRTNDLYGHDAGDNLIFNAAKAIKECFIGIGKTYRIGGDEFCVICENSKKEQIDCTLSGLDDKLIMINQKRQIKIEIAHGYALYEAGKGESINSAFSQADQAMYTHKAKLKGFYGRRSTDCSDIRLQ